MNRAILNLAFAMLLALIIPVHAQPRPADGRPTFTAAEQAIIARNEILRDIMRSDPETVRKALDLLGNANARGRMQEPPIASGSKKLTLDDDPARPAFDAQQNPDFAQLQRASPEAAHDLFQLLKKAGAGPRTPLRK